MCVTSETDEFPSTKLFGGDGGAPFDDGNQGIVGVTVRSGSLVDAIAVQYEDGSETHHGGDGGGKNELLLDQFEFIDEVEVCASKKKGILALTFKTNMGNVLGPCGGDGGFFSGGEDHVVSAPEGHKLVGIMGSAGDRLDSIGFRWGPIRSFFGGEGGTLFDDGNNPGIVSMSIQSDTFIQSIAVKYAGDKEVHHGVEGEGGKSEITLEEFEFIDEVKVRVSENEVLGLTLKTNKGNIIGRGRTSGDGEEHIVSAPEGRKLVGIMGRTGDRLIAIGLRWGRV